MSLKIRPIEDFMLEGVEQRFYETFGCLTKVVNAYEKARTLESTQGGKGLKYPYMFLRLASMSPNTESYSTNAMGRRGLQAVIADDQNQAYTVRVLPVNFAIEVEYYTDQFDLNQDRSALAFGRRWQFARRLGMLKFNIDYARLAFSVGCSMDESITIPDRNNLVESQSHYVITGSCVFHGYISEPVLGTQGIVNEVHTDTQVSGAKAITTKPRSTPVFWNFPSPKEPTNESG